MPVMPVGACIVAEAAERAGHRVAVLDLMFERDPLRALDAALAGTAPDVVGLSVRNIDNNDMHSPVTFFEDLPALVAAVRRRTAAPVVLGGSAVGIMPAALLRVSGASWAVIGDGEAVFPRFLDALARGDSPKDIAGMAWLVGDALGRAPTGWAEDLDGCQAPRFERWIDAKGYFTRLCTAPIQSKRGCPFKCVYCTYSMNEGTAYRLHDPERVVDAVDEYAARGVRDIEFVDNVFNAPYDHAMAICEGLARIRRRVRFQTMELNPRFVDDALLANLQRAGFVGVGISADSASEAVLARLRKGFTVRDVRRAAAAVRRHAVPCFWMFLLGGPGETEASVRETLEFAARFIRPSDVVCFGVGIRIYPGTALEGIARDEGVLTVPPAEMLEPVFYFSPALDVEWLMKSLHEAIAAHPNYMNLAAFVQPWFTSAYRLAYALGVRKPLWRHTRLIRRGLKLIGMDRGD